MSPFHPSPSRSLGLCACFKMEHGEMECRREAFTNVNCDNTHTHCTKSEHHKLLITGLGIWFVRFTVYMCVTVYKCDSGSICMQPNRLIFHFFLVNSRKLLMGIGATNPPSNSRACLQFFSPCFPFPLPDDWCEQAYRTILPGAKRTLYAMFILLELKCHRLNGLNSIRTLSVYDLVRLCSAASLVDFIGNYIKFARKVPIASQTQSVGMAAHSFHSTLAG